MKEDTVLHLFSTVQDGLTNIQNKLDEIHRSTEVRREYCQKQINDKTSNSMFRWVIGLIVVTMLGVGGVSTSTRIKMAETTTELKSIKEKVNSIEMNLESHRLKGGDYGITDSSSGSSAGNWENH